jgi:hypothetical protein
MKMQQFITSCQHIPATVIRAVVRQVGGWSAFQEMAKDITEHGIDGGFSGFIYYTDTVEFYARNREAINNMASEMADDFSQSTIEMIQSFNCLDNNFSVDEIGKTLYGPKSKMDDQIANAMAWFAAEEVARAYHDQTV